MQATMPVPVILANQPACTTAYLQSNRLSARALTTTSTPTSEVRCIVRITQVNSSDSRKSICLFAFCLGVVTYPKEPEREFSESGNPPYTECNRWHIVHLDRSRHMTTVSYLVHILSQVVAVLFRTSDFSRDKRARFCFSTSGKDILLAKYARGRWCFTAPNARSLNMTNCLNQKATQYYILRRYRFGSL